MAVKIRLSRVGRNKIPKYRIVVVDGAAKRDGRFIEIVGNFDPRRSEGGTDLKVDRVTYWMSKGAKPSETVSKLYKTQKAGAGK